MHVRTSRFSFRTPSLADPELFINVDGIEARLTKNRDVTQQVIDASAHHVRSLRKNLQRRLINDTGTRDRLLGALDRIEAVRLQATFERLSAVTVEEAGEVWRPPSDTQCHVRASGAVSCRGQRFR
jgi:hypothetical protein